MKTLLKFSCHCFVVSVITITTAISLPTDELDGRRESASVGGGSTVATVDHELLTREDVALFLKEMEKFKRISSTRLFQATTTFPPSEASVEAVSTLFDTMIPLAIGAAAAGLLVILLVALVVFLCYSNRKNAKKDLTLNKDLNRWDPQLLRPSKENIEAFYFGPPIPSVAEMIKQLWEQEKDTSG